MTWTIFTIILLFTFAFGLFFGLYCSPTNRTVLKREKGLSIKDRIEAKYFKKAAYSPSKDMENKIFNQDKVYSYFDTDDSK